jgi:hypothetical protein
MRALLVVVWLLLTAAAGWWLVNAFKAKSYYDAVLRDPQAASFAVESMNEQDQAFLSEVRSHWKCRQDATNTDTSQLLTACGLSPSVQSMVELLRSPLSPFSFTSAKRNQRSYGFAHMRQVYSEILTTRTIHLSEDGHLMLLRGSISETTTGLVYVFQDEPEGGIREAIYYEKK